jgi:Tfp pilus assembly protein PilO
MTANNANKNGGNLKSRLLTSLRDANRFRAAVVGTVLVAGYAFIYVPLSDKIVENTKKLTHEEHLLDLAHGIRQLEAQFRKFEGRLPKNTDSKEWVAYVLAGIRNFPLRMVTLDCEAPRDVGPYKAVVLRIELEGAFRDMDRFLRWLESNKRLFRTDALRIAPSRTNKNVLTMQLTVLGIMG